jgi:ABC-2 type transport system permease protein
MLTQRIPVVPDAAPGRASRTPAARYRRSLWLLTTRDLKVRYSTSALGWFWSILDPLVMSGIYWFVFTVVFSRDVGQEPYIVFLLAALLPWMWFTGATSDFTKAFSSQAKLVRSTRIPRTIWVLRLVFAKGFEFLASLPVLAVFAVIAGARLDVHVLLFPLAAILQAALLLGIGLIIAPLVVFFRDLPPELQPWAALNPLTGIFGLYRSAFFPGELDWYAVGVSAAISAALLLVGALVFRRSLPAVLKEI